MDEVEVQRLFSRIKQAVKEINKTIEGANITIYRDKQKLALAFIDFCKNYTEDVSDSIADTWYELPDEWINGNVPEDTHKTIRCAKVPMKSNGHVAATRKKREKTACKYYMVLPNRRAQRCIDCEQNMPKRHEKCFGAVAKRRQEIAEVRKAEMQKRNARIKEIEKERVAKIREIKKKQKEERKLLAAEKEIKLSVRKPIERSYEGYSRYGHSPTSMAYFIDDKFYEGVYYHDLIDMMRAAFPDTSEDSIRMKIREHARHLAINRGVSVTITKYDNFVTHYKCDAETWCKDLREVVKAKNVIIDNRTKRPESMKPKKQK